jgi:DHA1 family inner membrane transport protein
MTSRPTVLASAVLALALLGDSLLYAALPLHAATFGISIGWAGVLLSANRFVRLAAYPLLPRLAASGLRRFTIVAAVLGASSTLVFAVSHGPWPLLAARLVWGCVFGALSLSTLAYATEHSETAGRRVGLSLAIREVGPLLSLTAGTAAIAAVGFRPTLTALAALSFAAVVVSLQLPAIDAHVAKLPVTMRLPTAADWTSLAAGMVTDGIFPATIGLLVARTSGTAAGVTAAGLLLGAKRIAVILLAPLSGRAADRFGARGVTAAGLSIGAAGSFVIASGALIAGAIVVNCGAAVITAALPAFVSARDVDDRMSALARNAMARDAGAAVGPLAALLWLEHAGAGILYAASGGLLIAVAVFLATMREQTGSRFFTGVARLVRRSSGRIRATSDAPGLHEGAGATASRP